MLRFVCLVWTLYTSSWSFEPLMFFPIPFWNMFVYWPKCQLSLAVMIPDKSLFLYHGNLMVLFLCRGSFMIYDDIVLPCICQSGCLPELQGYLASRCGSSSFLWFWMSLVVMVTASCSRRLWRSALRYTSDWELLLCDASFSIVQFELLVDQISACYCTTAGRIHAMNL